MRELPSREALARHGLAWRPDAEHRGSAMHTQLQRQCLEVLHAKSVKEFVRISGEFGRSMGFHSMGAILATMHAPGLTEVRSVTSAPPEYVPIFEDPVSGDRDPVFLHCKRSSQPIFWTQETYVDAGQAPLWDEQAPFGLRSGVGVAFHLPRDRHFVFGLNSDQRSCCDRKAKLGLSLDIQQFAAYAQAAAFDLCIPYARSEDSATPAKSELEALRRSMDGLSDWEVGNAMGISETEVMLRLRRVTATLGCATRYEAALRAIRRGLVECG